MIDSMSPLPEGRFSALPTVPGKIIAIHQSYESRAAQRGRRPDALSYFLKPTSSIATSGSTVERPLGTQLLAFEGEIALIIGESARRVSRDRAWDHVEWVTAANDLGLYDLRTNDRGSNVRSKGRDGFTPVGPRLLRASDLDPRRLRLRTWVNGALAQEDTAEGLMFSLPQMVADLSQHLTLEPGDIILTGTPAGSSVIEPGDTVEVEVDSLATHEATGRLVTTVVQGTVPFDPTLGSLPAIDDTQRAEAWGSRAAAGLAPEADPSKELDRALREKLTRVPVAALSAEMRRKGFENVTIEGVRPLSPGARLVGRARTLRFVPRREDLFSSHGGGYNAQKHLFDTVDSGEVIVIEARSDASAGTLGDILAIRAHTRGAAGVVTDGAVRDSAAVAAVGLPVYASGSHPAVLGRRHVPWEIDGTIGCGGATVQPGDVIVGDTDGVIVIPASMVEDVVSAALDHEAEDEWIAARVREGNGVEGLFPLGPHWRAAYEAEAES